ncbi:Hypothetical predicted protein [Pelobates cultripes]|uniref:Uncharacterized protein n=2 Tax=Pelobates cultripes TaxID=61616 RepID=A0AAD1SF01_PELCU|nr:Hypothetical predicted protein [Pelobates cultripes]
MGCHRRSKHFQTLRGAPRGPIRARWTASFGLRETRKMMRNAMLSSPASTAGTEMSALDRIGEELRTIAASMATKGDMLTHNTAIQDALHAKIAGIRTDVGAQADCIQTLEAAMETQAARNVTMEAALAKQGELLLTMRRSVEDLDNRGRRCNIQVKGVPETDGEENAEELLSGLFRAILQQEAPPCFKFDRAHRAMRPRTLEEGPRDLICCLHSYQLKEAIMRKARGRPTWPYMGTQVALYQDLSPLMLDARRALLPVTTLLRDRGIQYKWGFPFALMIQSQEGWTAACHPDEIPGLLEGPPTPVPDWIRDSMSQRP